MLVGFELALTHWSYLYIPWFFPFVLLALLLPRRQAASRCRGGGARDARARSATGACVVTTRAAVLVVAAAALSMLVGLFVADLEGGPGIVDTPVYMSYGDRIEDGADALP